MTAAKLSSLVKTIRQCTHCEQHLPLGPRPILRASTTSKILIVGQAPGTKVHETGIPWNDPSGDRLRKWLAIDKNIFYDESKISILPMGFCYPGRGKSGDLPPRPECAELWREKLKDLMGNIEFTLLIGQYAQRYYLGKEFKRLTDTVQQWQSFLPDAFPTPHPSPRNQLWLKRNPWFELKAVPALRKKIQKCI